MNSKEFAPCFRVDCRFYNKWIKQWGKEYANIFCPNNVGRKYTNALEVFCWCAICTYFNKTNNFLKKEEK